MKKIGLFISIIIGAAIFSFFLGGIGLSSIGGIFKTLNWYYLLVYFLLSIATLVPNVLRCKAIIKGYKKKVGFWMLLRQTIAGNAISYITPAARIGGEPLRVYMLKKEANIDLRTGSSCIIIDKFVELTGAAIFGAIGLVLLFFTPGIAFAFKIILASVILYGFYGLFVLYYRTITNRGTFSDLFTGMKLYRISKLKNFYCVLTDVEKKMGKFFRKNKKEFLLSFLYYGIYGVLAIVELKFLLLALGIDASLVVIILALTVLGLAGFIPVPAALGVLEAGETGLFHALLRDGSAGFVLSLILRIRDLIFVALGFGLIAYFSGREIEKRLKKRRRKKT